MTSLRPRPLGPWSHPHTSRALDLLADPYAHDRAQRIATLEELPLLWFGSGPAPSPPTLGEVWASAARDDLLARLASDGLDIEPGRCDLDALREVVECIDDTGSVPWWVEDCRSTLDPQGPMRRPDLVAHDLRQLLPLL